MSASEYWQERASLDTTDALGEKDLELPDNVRFYLIASTQHGPARQATRHPLAKHMTNPAAERGNEARSARGARRLDSRGRATAR